MIYDLQELLLKMGAPELREKRVINWHYFDTPKKNLAGVAEIRLEADGERLIAELKHVRSNVQDDEGKTHPVYIEHFHMAAERTARPNHYRIISIAFDGAYYENPKQAVIELGLGLFHSRALDISVKMVEQTFNKQDIVEPAVNGGAAMPAQAHTPPVIKSKSPARKITGASTRKSIQFKDFLSKDHTQQPVVSTTPGGCVIIPFPSKSDRPGSEGRVRT